jgi:hypothetical protein
MYKINVWKVTKDYFEGITGYTYYEFDDPPKKTFYPEEEWVNFLLADDDFGAYYKGKVHPDLYEELFEWGARNFGTTLLFVLKKDDPECACGNFTIGPRPAKDELPRVLRSIRGPWGMVIG